MTVNLFFIFLLLFYTFPLKAEVDHTPDSLIVSSPPAYREVQGVCYNIDNFISIAEYLGLSLDSYGANSTVNYSAPVFPHITTLANALPQISMGQNDYILIQVTVPTTEWLNTHSLFNITPYFYFYDANGVQTTVFASENITLQFFDLFTEPNATINVCVTANKTIATQFQDLGYIISGVPREYLDATTFMILFRVGILNGQSDQLSINRFTKVTYFQATQEQAIEGEEYYTATEITTSFPPSLLPEDTVQYEENIADYNGIVTYLAGQGYDPIQCVKYQSNVYGIDYAVDNFYTAISVTPPAQLQANNTGEDYFNSPGYPTYSSEFIDLTAVDSPYIYVLSLNQNVMGAGLTSNVQVYNSQNLSLVNNGLIITSPDLPAFSAPDYPYVSEDSYPLFQINAFSVSELLASGVTAVIIAERISYNPVNFYQTSYDYVGKAYFFFGNTLTDAQTSYLNTHYGIIVNY